MGSEPAPASELTAAAARRLARAGQVMCLAGATLGLIGLLGWFLRAPRLTTLLDGLPPMMPNTAVGLIALGLAGAVYGRSDAPRPRVWVARLAALVVLAFGVATIVQYALGIVLQIDQLVYGAEAGPYPGRPSPPTAVALALLALALQVIDRRPDAAVRPAEWLTLGAALLAFIALLGLAFGVGPVYRWARSQAIGVSLPTAVALLLIAAGYLHLRPRCGLMRTITSRGPGGALLRRLVAPTVIGPALLGLLVVRSFTLLGIRDTPFLVATLVASMTVVGLAVLAITAVPLNRAHEVIEEATAALRRSQERFDLALRGADLGAWDWNVQTGDVVFNARWAEMRGYRLDEVRPHVHTWVEGVHPDDWARVQRQLEGYLAGTEPEYSAEHRVRTKSGQWIWVLDRGKVFERDADGRPIRMVGTELDVTQQRQLADEQRFLADVSQHLASSLDREDTLGKMSCIAVRDLADLCIVDVVEDGAARRLQVVSRDLSMLAACEGLRALSPAPRPSSLLRTATGMTEPMLIERTPEIIEALADTEEHVEALRALRLHSVIVAPLLSRGELVGAFALAASAPFRRYGPHDLHLAGQLAQRIALAMENAELYRTARRAIDARDEILGVVAHDLRSPLATIFAQVSLLRRRDTEIGRRSTDAIERAATRMNRLIQDLLDVSRMEGGGLALDRAPLPPASLVLEAVDAHLPVAASASIDLRPEVDDELPEVFGDRDRLLQVLENLIGNALKFTPPGGSVTVAATEANSEVVFRVTDTGPGIAVEDQPRIFDRFWQAQRAERRGAGLGLPIVKGIVEAHGGRVWVKSAVGRGSSLYFSVPIAPGLGDEPARHEVGLDATHA